MVDYFDRGEMSQSKLKLLLGDPKYFNTVTEPERYFEEKVHFLIGDGVDFGLTRPTEVFTDVFHVSNIENKPSDTIKSIVNQVFDSVRENYNGQLGSISNVDYKTIIILACDDHNYQVRWKEETRWAKVCEAYEYWEDLKTGYGKTILSGEEGALIDQMIMSFKSNEATSKYFKPELGVEILYQVQIFFDYEGVACKGMLDLMRVDHANKTILPLDVKTMGDYTYNFPKALRKRRYDIQAAFYTHGLKTWQAQRGLENYTILPFKFLVDSTKDPGTPMVFTCSKSLLHMGEFGRCETYYNLFDKNNKLIENTKNNSIKGFKQLMDLYKYYMEHGFEVRKEVRDNNFDLPISWSGIV